MSEILQIFHHSPPSYNQMYSQLQRECNWSFESADYPSFRSFEEVSDRFQCSEFAGNSFMNFSSSSFDELSKVTAVNEKNRCVKKRKLESVNCTSGSIEKTKARRSILNGNTKHNMDPKLDYIHVRARRGQATDSHSLAERARREKIKKKMQCLQDLVPGCNKITSKAAILDEIISYIQCLQSDVEFLTVKLAASTTSVDFNMNNSLPEEIVVQTNM